MYKGLLIVAYVLSLILSIVRRKKSNQSLPIIIAFTTLLIMYGCIGARILACIENGEFPSSGFSFFGALYFVPIAMSISGKVFGMSPLKCVDDYGIYVPLILAMLRIGCYISGCCGANPIIIDGVEYIPPIQLIESVLDLTVFIFLIIEENKKLKSFEGETYIKVMLSYSFIRLVMENYRDTEKALCGMSNGQWLSILTFFVATGAFSMLKHRSSKKRHADE